MCSGVPDLQTRRPTGDVAKVDLPHRQVGTKRTGTDFCDERRGNSRTLQPEVERLEARKDHGWRQLIARLGHEELRTGSRWSRRLGGGKAGAVRKRRRSTLPTAAG